MRTEPAEPLLRRKVMRPVDAGILAILLLCSASACGGPDYRTSTVQFESHHVVTGGVVVVVHFTGGPKGIPRDNPCWARYRAAATSQNADHVIIGVWITTHATYGPCTAVGYHRTLPVSLDAPLNGREVLRAPMDTPFPFEDG